MQAANYTCVTVGAGRTFETARLLPVGSAAGSSADIAFTHGPIFGFSPRRGDTLHPAKVHLDRLRGGGLRPQN